MEIMVLSWYSTNSDRLVSLLVQVNLVSLVYAFLLSSATCIV